MTDNQKLATVLELLASRICHDIISPVGAINNGVELMEEMGADGMEDGVELIGYSAAQAAAKLSAFRIAYGAGGKDSSVKPEDIQKAFGELIRADGKISQTWDPYGKLGPDPLPKAYCKMLMCSLMLAMEFLPKGGYISIRPGMGDDEGNSLVIAEGEGAVVREGVEDALNQAIEPDDLDPRLVHPYAMSVIGESYGYKITLKSQAEGRIEFVLDCPEVVEEKKTNEEEGDNALTGTAH